MLFNLGVLAGLHLFCLYVNLLGALEEVRPCHLLILLILLIHAFQPLALPIVFFTFVSSARYIGSRIFMLHYSGRPGFLRIFFDGLRLLWVRVGIVYTYGIWGCMA
jgi:hypothetical protein